MSNIFTIHRQPYGEVMNPISADGVRFYDKNGDITEVRMTDGMVNIHVGRVTVSAEHLEDLMRRMVGRGEQPPAEAQRCTCPSGDGSLRWPCPAHPPEAQEQGGGEVVYQAKDETLGAWYDVAKARWDNYDSHLRRAVYTAPPSAPVGVPAGVPVGVVREYLDARACYDPSTQHPNSPEGLRLREARNDLDAALYLAQQPAAVDMGVRMARLCEEASEVLEAVGVGGGPLPSNWRWPLADELSGIAALAQQPAATLPDEDDSDLTVAYMAGRHDGRKEAQQPAAEAQQVAWMRRCAFDRVDVLTLAKSDRPRGWNMHAVTENKALPDDVPLYAHPTPSAPVGVADAWQEGYQQGVLDERTSEDCIGIAGFNAKVEPARVNPYLAQQPAAVDGDNPYPVPRNRQEAAALAKLALAYLGVTSAHIDAVVARCETDLAGQQGGSDNG